MSAAREGMTGRQSPLRGSHAAAVALFLALVGVLTVAAALEPEVARTLAASPARLAHGHVWLLVSSGLLAERPVGASVVSFVVLATLALAVCGPRTFWLAAAVGHVGSTVVVYGVIGLARVSEPRAFASVFWSSDYGVSAISAAWLGAIATVGWRVRGKNIAGRLAIGLSCLAVGLFAYTARPGLTIIAGEHVLAFAFGIAIAGVFVDPVHARPRLRELLRHAQPSAMRKLDPVALAALATGAAVVAASAMPSAVAALGETIAASPPPSGSRCIAAWNAAHPIAVANAPVLVASMQRRLCTLVFARSDGGAAVVLGRWRDGKITNWHVSIAPSGELTTNAVVADVSGYLARYTAASTAIAAALLVRRDT